MIVVIIGVAILGAALLFSSRQTGADLGGGEEETEPAKAVEAAV
jgi:hypothetical protein